MLVPDRKRNQTPEPAVLDVTLGNLYVIAHETHPLALMLRQVAITEFLMSINARHAQYLEAAALAHDVDPSTLAKGLCIRGSATLPPALRQARDVDITVDMGVGYDPKAQRLVLGTIFDLACSNAWDGKGRVFSADISDPRFSGRTRELQTEKLFSVYFVSRSFEISELSGAKDRFQQHFKLPEREISILDTFSSETISEVLRARAVESEQRGISYSPSPDEQDGVGLTIAIQIEVSSLDNLNCFAPFKMGARGDKFECGFLDRNDPIEDSLCFSSPLEEVASKFFAILTDHEKAMIDEIHARNLYDLYLRTCPEPLSVWHFAPYRSEPLDVVVQCVQMMWPAHPAFYQREPYFKKIDPAIGSNLKQVRRGLLIGLKHGVIGGTVFGESVNEAGVESLAQKLLENAWCIAQSCFGVVRSGSNKNPAYELSPTEPVRKYWGYCRGLRALFLSQERRGTVSDIAQTARMEREMRRLLRAVFTEGNPASIDTASINALCRADTIHSRFWQGLKKRD